MEVISAANLYLRQLGDLRPKISSLNDNIFMEGGPEPTQLVEISGVRKSGKSLLLMQLVAQYVMSCDVVFLNTSNKIDIQLIGKLIKAAVSDANPAGTDAELQLIFEKCMNSLEIINCFSTNEFEITLKALDHYMLLDNERISLIVVDTLCEFYWLDLQPKSRQRKYTYYMNCLTNLKRLCNRFYISCIYSIDNSFCRNSYVSSKSIKIDHKLELNYLGNKQRTLNNKNIVINDGGVQFADK